jgi:hypothetical protein
MGKYVYTADDAVAYWTKMDVSNATIAGMVAYDGTNAAGGRLPKGLFPRVRYLRHPTTGRERSIICGDVTAALWTSAAGTVQALFDYGSNASANYTLAGRTGERVRT